MIKSRSALGRPAFKYVDIGFAPTVAEHRLRTFESRIGFKLGSYLLSARRGAQGPVDLGFAPTEAERRLRTFESRIGLEKKKQVLLK